MVSQTNDNPMAVSLKVWGQYACFTRPEMKVERVSYPVCTPTAARGILESVYWKPEFHWDVMEIWVLNPINYFSILRNEIKSRQSFTQAQKWAMTGGGFSARDDRTQRLTRGLKDVAYVIKAVPVVRKDININVGFYRGEFCMRARKGGYFSTPYLGCREFPANFAMADGTERPHPIDEDIGSMLLQLNYAPDNTGIATPSFFDAKLRGGILYIPEQINGGV